MLFKKTNLQNVLNASTQLGKVYAPRIVDGTSRFTPYEEDGVLPDFSLQNTKLPPKGLLFPSTEKLYTWGKKATGEAFIESACHEHEPFIVFGARPCDVASIERMDQVFLTKGYVDEFYQARRNALTLVALACNRTLDSCFCDSMGTDPNAAPEADILLLEGNDAFEVQVQTERGQALADLWQPYLEEGTVERERTACTTTVKMEGVAEKLHNLFDSPLWDEVSTACLTCGSCTFICPTCHCFDLSQARKKEENARFRCWDSCMFKDYTLMAGNHNPREQKRNRVRQRFMHKLCFFEERYGEPLCVGCGRCLIDCPATMDITAIIERVAAEPEPEGASHA